MSRPAGFRLEHVQIPSGGVDLAAIVLTPAGDGPFPLLVMPSSWAVDDLEYVGAAAKLVHGSGYAVVSYTSRGFWDSGGEVDVAGPDTVADVSRVIDWAFGNLPVDQARVGAVGISYGAGTSLLAAADDDRITAVAAMSTWTDLAASFYPNRTESRAAATILLDSAAVTGRPGPVLQQLRADYAAGNDEATLPILRDRSPINRVDALNARQVPVLLANGWEDGFFPPSQVVSFFEALTGPRRLLLAAGEHATAELGGLIGLPNDPWSEVRAWMDEHLRGIPADQDAVQVKPANGGGWLTFPDWPPAAPSRLFLGQDGLVPGESAAWSHRIDAGLPSFADSGLPLVSGAFLGYLRLPVEVPLPLVSRLVSGVWTSGHQAGHRLLIGAPRLHLTVTPSTADTTLFAYLYAVDDLDLGALVSTKPYSIVGTTPGEPVDVEWELEAIAWTLPPGHRVALVVDTVDLRYDSRATIGSTVTFSSPSWLDLPLR